jgi:hypothetical protein
MSSAEIPDFDDPRFVSFGEPITEIMGIPVEDVHIAKLKQLGLANAEIIDDLHTATTGSDLLLSCDSTLGKILVPAFHEDETGDIFMRTFHRVVRDIVNDQFEKNWAEYL